MFSLTYFKQVQELGISSHLQILALKEIWKSSIHSLILHTQSPKSMSFIVTVLIHLCVWRKALLICSLIPSDNFYIYIVLLIGMERAWRYWSNKEKFAVIVHCVSIHSSRNVSAMFSIFSFKFLSPSIASWSWCLILIFLRYTSL